MWGSSHAVAMVLKVNVVWFKCTDLRSHDHVARKPAMEESRV